MTETVQVRGNELTAADASAIVAEWLGHFAAAVQSGSASDLAELFLDGATWRDFMALQWDFSHAIGRDLVVARFLELSKAVNPRSFAINTELPPIASDGGIRAFVDFATRDRVDRGYVYLVQGAERFVCSVLQTQVVALQDYPEKAGDLRVVGKAYGVVPNRTRWSADRRKEASFEDSDPAVLVLGAGHNGLTIAAYLGALGVPALIIDRELRVGDTWRKRYAALALHSTVHGDHLPYLRYPPTWPAHTPKDKFADWLESYATIMDLNVWTSTEFLNGHYDDDTQRWTIRVRRADGSIRELCPRHFFVAGGLFAGPKIPDVKGLSDYTGLAVHSDSFQGGDDYPGRKAVVVGAGVSGHEIAHDLYEHGASVTLVQRSATYVVSYEAYHKLWNPLFAANPDFPVDFADQMTYALPPERSDEINKELVKLGAELDKDLLDRLQARGFKLDWGPDGTGIIGAHMSGKDSYHISIGAAELIADGNVHLKHGVELTEIKDDKTVVFSDGSEMPDVDLIVFATGYHQFWGHIKPALGAAAARIDKAYGRAADKEYANTWRRSAQPGLWFGTGFIRMARYYAKFSALLIKAIEVGIEPVDPEKAGAELTAAS